MPNVSKIILRTFFNNIVAATFVCAFLSYAQANDNTIKVIDENLFDKIIDSIKGVPQEKGEFETTPEFNQRKREYANSIAKQYSDVVYVFKHETFPYYNADEGKLLIRTPFAPVFRNPFHAIWDNDDRYSIQLPRFRKKAGVVKFDEMQELLVGRKSAEKIIQHIVTVYVPKINGINDVRAEIEKIIPPKTAKLYKDKYRWVVGVSFNFEEGGEFDEKEKIVGDDYLDEIKKGYLEYTKFYKTNGRISFVALIIDGESTVLFEYYSPSTNKANVAKYLK